MISRTEKLRREKSIGGDVPSDVSLSLRQEGGSIAAQVHELLMEQILDMELRPFQELSEARLAAEFGVSRTPVREALARLARRGLVEILPQRGTIVSPLSEDLIAKSRFIREALERGAGKVDEIGRHQRQHAGRQEAHQAGKERGEDRDVGCHEG